MSQRLREFVQQKMREFKSSTEFVYDDTLIEVSGLSQVTRLDLERAVEGMEHPSVRVEIWGPNDYSDTPYLVFLSTDPAKMERIDIAHD